MSRSLKRSKRKAKSEAILGYHHFIATGSEPKFSEPRKDEKQEKFDRLRWHIR